MSDLLDALGLLAHPAGINVMAKKGRYVINTHAYDIEKLATRVQILDDWDVYACLNPARTMSGKPAIEDIITVQRFMIDLDPMEFYEGIDLTPMRSAVQEWLYAQLDEGPAHHTTIWSGRGIQIWVPIAPTNECLRAHVGIRGLIRAMAEDLGEVAGCRIDTTSGEISRVARLPGTTNSKTGRKAGIISLEDPKLPKRISLEALDRWAEMEYDARVEPLPVTDTLDALLPAMAPWARDFALFGADGRLTSRHARGYAMVADLAKLGVPQDRARVMLSVACSRCRPPLADSAWMDRTINAHY